MDEIRFGGSTEESVEMWEYIRSSVLLFVRDECKILITADIPNIEYIDLRTMQLRAMGFPAVEAQVLKAENRIHKRIPSLYLFTGIITIALFWIGILLMFVDAVLSLTNVGSSVYIVWCLCCLSLYFTNKIALSEWKVTHGKKRKPEKRHL